VRADLMFVYKLVFGLLDMNVEDFFILRFTPILAHEEPTVTNPLVKLMQGIAVLGIWSFVCELSSKLC